MNLQEVVEEITEKLPPDISVSPKSIVRKVNQLRDRILRSYGPAQRQFETVLSTLDITEGQSEYPLPCPPGSVVDVDILNTSYGGNGKWVRLSQRQFNDRTYSPYYYFLAGSIGIYPTPEKDVPNGFKIFHVPLMEDLTTDNMNAPTGLDPDFDMLLVFGVLNETTTGPISIQWFEKYESLLEEYINTVNGYEQYVVKERW